MADARIAINLVMYTRSGLFQLAKNEFTAHELRLKQSVWDWLRSQSPAELEKVRLTACAGPT